MENFEVLKGVSDCFDKISKNRDDIKDELTKRIREEWQSYIKNIDVDLLRSISNSMQRSMEELEKAVCGDRSKKEPRVFIQIATYWKAGDMKIDFVPDISSVKNDLEQVMMEVTNFQDNCNQLSFDPEMIFETRDQKKFVKNEAIRSELSKVE